jgi:zinc-ribbon domain
MRHPGIGAVGSRRRAGEGDGRPRGRAAAQQASSCTRTASPARESGGVANLSAMYNYEPPEAQSIKSMLHIARILAIIFGVLFFLGGLAYVAWVAYLASICSSFVGIDAYCGGYLAGYLIFPLLILIWGVFDIIIYLKMKSIEAMVNARQYEQAKSTTLVWMILGFIIGGIIIGILLLIAYIKFDPLINAARSGGGQGQWGQPGQMAPPPQQAQWGQPQPATWGQPSAPPPMGKMCPSCHSPNAAGAQFCAKCGAALPP